MVPLTETINLVVECLYSERSRRVPPVDRKVLKKLLQIATGGIFMYRDKFYKQVDGVAMGSPLGPSLANFFLGHIEETSVFQDSSDCPKLYIRYVDDILAVFPKGTTYHPFFQRLNKQHKNLKFTVEESEGSFPFLNVEMVINGETVDTWIFRKKTHTGVMLNFSAIVPNSWKLGLIRGFINTAKMVCSTEDLFNQEILKLRDLFSANGYPKAFLTKHWRNAYLYLRV